MCAGTASNEWEFRALFFRRDNTRIVGEIRGDTGKIVDKLLTRYARHRRFDGRSRIIGKHEAQRGEKSTDMYRVEHFASTIRSFFDGESRFFSVISCDVDLKRIESSFLADLFTCCYVWCFVRYFFV